MRVSPVLSTRGSTLRAEVFLVRVSPVLSTRGSTPRAEALLMRASRALPTQTLSVPAWSPLGPAVPG